MGKVLFISNIAERVGSFSVASIAAAKECGIDFYYAANWEAASTEQRKEDEDKFGIKLVPIDLVRSPYSPKNINAYKQLVDFIRKENVDYIHCNTPVGGLLGRLAGKKCKVKKVIYQAHGFHFWEGAPLKNWLIYYPIERWLAHYTDAIITINKEDYERAQGFRLRNNGKVYYVPGVGTDISRFDVHDVNREAKREELGLAPTDVALVSVGEYTEDKNLLFTIKAMPKLPENYKYFLCGEGHLREEYEKCIREHHLEKRVKLLGYRTDIPELLKSLDLYVFPSTSEGLSRALMEAMAAKIPVVCSRIRGNTDLIKDENCIFDCHNEDEYINSVSYVISKGEEVCKENFENIKAFSLPTVIDIITKIYQVEFFKEKTK